jgi:hypothetical protein
LAGRAGQGTSLSSVIEEIMEVLNDLNTVFFSYVDDALLYPFRWSLKDQFKL